MSVSSLYEELIRALSSARLLSLARNHTRKFKQADPFPHLVIDGIFPRRVLKHVSDELPEETGNDGCSNLSPVGCLDQKGIQFRKSAISSEAMMGPYTRMLFSFLKSSQFVQFLEQLTGVRYLIPDPHFRGSGVHLTARGGQLALHADFNRYLGLDLRRRVNTFLFLNHAWPEEFGGHLELWSRDLASCRQRILPSFGRFVVFLSTDFSYHGHPRPLPAPPHRLRRSLALYYFTNGCPAKDCLDGDCHKSHTTLWQTPRCADCTQPGCRHFDPGVAFPMAGNITQPGP